MLRQQIGTSALLLPITLGLSLLTPPTSMAQAAEVGGPIAVENAGFEEGHGLPSGWEVVTAAPATSSSVRQDTQVQHSGACSLLIDSAAPASVVVQSGAHALRVGRIYRLLGWIRTERAHADPTSRYPTAVPACLSMSSFPFTNHSPAVGATNDWTRVETLFIATKSSDRIRLHLGNNGSATGKAWFDDIELEEVQDIAEYVPLDTVRWADDGYRYDDRGWIFVHIEGKPYQRGYQFGYLVADEIVAYLTKLATQENPKDPPAGWAALRGMADALMLRKFDEEFLTEMKGIADGAARAGAKYDDRRIDLLDIVTLNSVVDLGQLRGALRVTPHALTGRSFLSAEEEMKIPDQLHRCSSFAASGPATADGRVVFGQIFMWSGYTGVHFNVLCDVQPSDGHRLVYQTFPGGIHSGTDFYMNSAGIIIGETTVAQTPFDSNGTPQSNRIRKAAQYASSIDDVAQILRDGNNGLYTNDWPIADVKTSEVAILLLGTRAEKLWRSSDNPAPFGTPGFLWANNNPRDLGVRREYMARTDDAPYDLVFSPWNRDVAFWQFYQNTKGTIDSIAAVNLWASSPINRSHACDGKVTTSEMAEQLVFLAHQGKVTLREKFPAKDNRRMPDLPGASPHLTYGYSVASPVYITDRLKEARSRSNDVKAAGKEPEEDLAEIKDVCTVAKKSLWKGTMIPGTGGENWLVSGSAAYWSILDDLPDDRPKAFRSMRDRLADNNCSFLYTISREGDVVPAAARMVYDRFGEYRIPRIKGTYALHQLRLRLGNELFLRLMSEVHASFAGRETATAEFLDRASEIAGQDVRGFMRQWVERAGLPDPAVSATVRRSGSRWSLRLEVTQASPSWDFLTTVAVDAGNKRMYRLINVKGAKSRVELDFAERPSRVLFNAGNDIPVARDRFYVWPDFTEDFHRATIVYGTSRQIEANHTLALRWQTTLADAFSEILPPVIADSEVTAEQLASRDLILLGPPSDNSLVDRLREKLPVEFGRNWFRWAGRTYASGDDGLFIVLPSPFDPKRILYLIFGNSALQLHEMTKSYTGGLPSWAVYKGAEIKEQGYHTAEQFDLVPATK